MKLVEALERFPRVLTALRGAVPSEHLEPILANELPPDGETRLNRVLTVLSASQIDLVSDAAVDFVFQVFRAFDEFFARLGPEVLLAVVAPTQCPGCEAAEAAGGVPLSPEQLETLSKHSLH